MSNNETKAHEISWTQLTYISIALLWVMFSINEQRFVPESTLSQSNEIHPVIASRKAIIQAHKVMRLPEFQYAASVAERLLASNTFLNQQISFMDSIRDPHGIL